MNCKFFFIFFYFFCTGYRSRTCNNGFGDHYVTNYTKPVCCGQSRTRTCTTGSSNQRSTIGAICPFVCNKYWQITHSSSSNSFITNIAESVRVELTWVSPQPQLSKPVQYHSANPPYMPPLKEALCISKIPLFCFTALLLSSFVASHTCTFRSLCNNLPWFLSHEPIKNCGEKGNRTPEPFTVHCFQDSFLDQPDSLHFCCYTFLLLYEVSDFVSLMFSGDYISYWCEW